IRRRPGTAPQGRPDRGTQTPEGSPRQGPQTRARRAVRPAGSPVPREPPRRRRYGQEVQGAARARRALHGRTGRPVPSASAVAVPEGVREDAETVRGLLAAHGGALPRTRRRLFPRAGVAAPLGGQGETRVRPLPVEGEILLGLRPR